MKQKIIPYAILAVIITVEHLTLGRLLKGWELTQRAIGGVTVLGWAYPIAVEEYGAYGEDIWAVIAGGFVTAGTVTILLDFLTDGRLLQE